MLALATLVLYVVLAPRHVVDGDNSEFVTLSVTGGAAHPSGYPVYVLWLRAMSWIPGASPAHTAAIATSILGAATVLVLHAACRAWGARPFPATVAVAIVATGPVVLRVSTEAEVFALNNLTVATVLWLGATNGPLRGHRRALALGLVAGLGLGDHLTCVLAAPVGILGVVRAAREQGGAARGYSLAFALASVGLVVGLSSYAYLLVAPDTPMSWGSVRTVHRVVEMFLREDYGGATAFRVGGPEVSAWTNVAALAKTLGRAWLWAPALAGVALLVVRCVRPQAGMGEPRSGWIALAFVWLLAGPILVMRFNVPPTGLGLYVNQRFHVLPALLLAIPVAHGLGFLTIRRETLATVLASTVLVAALVAPSLPYLGRVHSPAVETGALNLLRSLPQNAVVIHGQDELHAVTGYVQAALGVRPDVRVVTWPLMTLPWYRERVARQGVVSGPGPGGPEEQLVRHLASRGVPVLVDHLQRDIIRALPTYPYGVLMRVVPPGEKTPTVIEVLALNESLFAKFALDYPRPGPDDEFATEVHARYAYTWELIAKALEAQGYTAQAARARMHADKLRPQ
jgi:hypothetical protein